MKSKFHLSMIAFVIGLIAISLLVVYPQSMPQKPNTGSLFAPEMNEIHQHAVLLVKIFDEKIDFNVPEYEMISHWANFEAPYNDIIHIRSDQVTVRYLFETMNFKVDDKCFVFSDGRKFCTDANYSLKYFVNGNQISDIGRHDLVDGDRILISYGQETKEELKQQLDEINSYPSTVDLGHLLGK